MFYHETFRDTGPPPVSIWNSLLMGTAQLCVPMGGPSLKPPFPEALGSLWRQPCLSPTCHGEGAWKSISPICPLFLKPRFLPPVAKRDNFTL